MKITINNTRTIEGRDTGARPALQVGNQFWELTDNLSNTYGKPNLLINERWYIREIFERITSYITAWTTSAWMVRNTSHTTYWTTSAWVSRPTTWTTTKQTCWNTEVNQGMDSPPSSHRTCKNTSWSVSITTSYTSYWDVSRLTTYQTGWTSYWDVSRETSKTTTTARSIENPSWGSEL